MAPPDENNASGSAPRPRPAYDAKDIRLSGKWISNDLIFRGRVVDEAGNPISNVVVQTDYAFDGGAEREFDWTTRTDTDGRFEWASDPPGETEYWIETEGNYDGIRRLALAADGSEHRIVLKSMQ